MKTIDDVQLRSLLAHQVEPAGIQEASSVRHHDVIATAHRQAHGVGLAGGQAAILDVAQEENAVLSGGKETARKELRIAPEDASDRLGVTLQGNYGDFQFRELHAFRSRKRRKVGVQPRGGPKARN